MQPRDSMWAGTEASGSRMAEMMAAGRAFDAMNRAVVVFGTIETLRIAVAVAAVAKMTC